LKNGTLIDRRAILSLIPHQGAMCLLDSVERWSGQDIVVRSRSHLAPDNPLRRNNRLELVCGAEYAFQAAALHGALTAGSVPHKPGYVASLRLGRFGAGRLDDPAHGLLNIHAMLELNDPAGLIYGFALCSEDGALLLEGRGTIVFPHV
jgi:predicted hotdog family 3-hydroxylacyl-ACP dehydratase